MSEVDPLLMAMTSSGLIDEEIKNDGEKMSAENDSDDMKRSSSSPGPCDDSQEREISSPRPLLIKRTSPTPMRKVSGDSLDGEMYSEFRTVRLKRPNATAIEGIFELKNGEKRRKSNYSDDYKNPDLYSLNSGVLKEIFERKFSETQPIMVQMMMKAKTKEKRPQICLSDGKFMTEKCILTDKLGDKFIVQKLNNPVVKILQWSLKDAQSIEGRQTVMVIQNLVIVKNLPNFPILGLPQPLHRMKTATSAAISKNSVQASTAPILTWKSIICFLNEVDANVGSATDKRTFMEVICKQIIAKTEYINEPTPQGWRYLCTDCNLYKCRRLSQIVNHIQLSHLPHFPGYKCPHCSKNFKAILSFENHIKDDHFFNTKSKSNPPKRVEISSSLPAPMAANNKIKGISDLAAGILSSMDSHFMTHPGPGASQNGPGVATIARSEQSPGPGMMSEVSFSNNIMAPKTTLSQPSPGPGINVLLGQRQQIILGPSRGA